MWRIVGVLELIVGVVIVILIIGLVLAPVRETKTEKTPPQKKIIKQIETPPANKQPDRQKVEENASQQSNTEITPDNVNRDNQNNSFVNIIECQECWDKLKRVAIPIEDEDDKWVLDERRQGIPVPEGGCVKPPGFEEYVDYFFAEKITPNTYRLYARVRWPHGFMKPPPKEWSWYIKCSDLWMAFHLPLDSQFISGNVETRPTPLLNPSPASITIGKRFYNPIANAKYRINATIYLPRDNIDEVEFTAARIIGESKVIDENGQCIGTRMSFGHHSTFKLKTVFDLTGGKNENR